MEAAQNRDESAKPVRGRPFEPGNRANPGGRPKGLSAKVRELAPPEKLTEFYLAILNRDGKELRKLGIKVSEVQLSDRLKAADWLADRGYGKAPQHTPVEGADPLELDGVDASIAAVLDDLAGAREKKAARDSAAGEVAGPSEERAAPAAG